MTAHDNEYHGRPNRTQQQNQRRSCLGHYTPSKRNCQMKCTNCGAVFDEPTIYEYRENLDGEHGWATFVEMLCPECGCDDLEDTNDE